MNKFSRIRILIVSLTLLFVMAATLLSQAEVLEFEHLTLEDGLSNLRVDAIEQDFMGYMWFGTKRGLCRYNGYDFEVFKSRAMDSTSLEYHQIESLFEDRDHDLWIGSWGGGLHLYNRPEDNIRSISFAKGDIHAISQDSEGYIWVGSDVLQKYDKVKKKDNVYHFWSSEGRRERRVINIIQSEDRTFVNIAGLGLLRYNKDNDDFSSVLLLEDCKDCNISKINEVFLYNNQTFWLGTDQGLFEYAISGDRSLRRIEDASGNGVGGEVNFIINESYKHIWIGADGLYKYDIIGDAFQHYQHDVDNPYSLSNDLVTCGFTDNQGNLWFGTYASGINVFKNVSVDFHKHSIINQELDNYSRNITSITEDSEGNLWLGTWDKGVLIFNKRHQLLNSYHRQFQGLSSLEKERIRTLRKGPDDEIWIGCSSGLLARIHTRKKSFELFHIPISEDEELRDCHVTSLSFESDSLLWVGTATRGLFLFNMKKRYFMNYKNRERVNELNILDLQKDWNGNLWIATYKDGVFRQDKDRKLEKFLFEEISDQRISGANFISIFMDSNENLWFGTEFHGLIKLTKDNEITVYPISKELENNEITSILEDRFGNLWLATTEGILRFEESRKAYRHYTWQDGLVADEFNYNSSYQREDETIFLGGNNGLVYFNPLSTHDNLTVPPVYIESFYLDNRKVHYAEPGSPLSQPVNLSEKITLKHSQNVFGFDFLAVNYISTAKNQYAYKLEGFGGSDWNDLGTRRTMTFTNLDFGSYVLWVKGSNNDGVWNEEGTSIAIQILPPIWRTWWAYVIYSLVLCFFVFLLYRGARQQLRMRQQIRMQHFEREKESELSNMKLQFFTNISHEFKVPLSLIISPLEDILSSFKGSSETRQKLLLVKRNASRLLQLIKLLIDFRKAEQDVLALNLGQHDMIKLIREVVNSFKSIIAEENKHIEVRTELSSLTFEFDRNKMERVLYNLIANATSFTEDLGEVILSINHEEEDQIVSVEVRDTGIGIREEDQARIFEKYYKSENNSGDNSSNTGSGIGLYLCKKIIELHQGTIDVKSASGKGSNFIFRLPASDALVNERGIAELNDIDLSPGMEMLEILEQQNPPTHPEDVPLILLVEDHAELRTHLKKMLWTYYRVEEAENGKTGLEKAKELHPDLIVSDIIMPEMDGVEMCKQVKRDPKTEHIPVILLSAKSDLDSKIEGYEKGADDFLEKPFYPQYLLARIRNLIESREKLSEHFGRGTRKKPKIAGLTPLDREFLEKVFYKIEKNIGNSEFNINELSSELGMSRVHLYRRFKDLTGNTPKDYMKETRLKAAAVLLEENRFTVSEVAYQVGFNTPSNFTASFKSFYGISPKEYKSS